MYATWRFNENDRSNWQSFVRANLSNEFVKDRERRNIHRKTVDLSRGMLWFVHVGCQVTTQQRSGPTSAVSRFLESHSRTLSYAECVGSSNVKDLVHTELSNAGLRRAKTIADNLSEILANLEGGGWTELERQLKTIDKRTTMEKERRVARYVENEFPGLGPKQSRNFIQWLGLTRYEIPVDSRITRKMKALGCSFVPSAAALHDETVYLLVQGGLQQVAEMLGIYPCILDACIFSSFDVRKR